MTPGVGSTLGRYRLEASLGRGGMAEVFRATDERLGRAVAVKVILPSYAEQPLFVERFLREARLVAALEHPNVVPVYDFGEHQGAPFLVMPFLEGGTLAARLIGAPLPLPRVAAWVGQLAEALDAAHQQGVLHRDVKPGNVLIGKGDRLMLADFGIAKMTDSVTRLTATGSVVGTPVYMAPELAQGRPASAASDLYALAVMAYEMLTGRPPFTGDSALSVLHQHVHTPPPPLSVEGSGLPAALDQVFAAALAKDPAQRPASGDAFAKGLEAALAAAGAGMTVPATVASERTTVLPTDPRQPSLAGVGGRLVIAVLLAAVAISGWLSFGRLRREAASDPRPPAVLVAESAGTHEPARPEPADVAPPSPPVPSPAAAPPVAPAQKSAPAAPPAPAMEEPATGPEPELPTEVASPAPTEPLRGRPGGARLGSRLRPGVAETKNETQRELPRPGTVRLAAADFERIRDQGSRGERAGNARAGFLRAYADGGLTYLAGDDQAAAQKLRTLSEQDSPGSDFGPLSLLRKLAGAGPPQPWLVAVAYGDPRRVAGDAIATELAAHPDNSAALFARAMVAHLDGNHRQAAEVAGQVLARVPQAQAARTALYAAEELEHAGDRQAALASYRRVAEIRAPEAGFAAVQGARVALELQLAAEARSILDAACRNGARVACERLRQLGDGQ